MSFCMIRNEHSTTSCRDTGSFDPKRLPWAARKSSAIAIAIAIDSFLAEMDGRMDGTLWRELGGKVMTDPPMDARNRSR